MNTFDMRIVSSQYKHLPKRTLEEILPRVIKGGSMLKNDMFSFQVLYAAADGTHNQPVTISAVCGDLPIGAWRVDCVPLLNVHNPYSQTGYEDNEPGLYPDVLMERPANPEVKGTYEQGVYNLTNATGGVYQSVWFTVNPDSALLKAGEYDIRITATDLIKGEVLAEDTLTVEVIDAELPENDLMYTNWFYEDVLCDTFDVELYSDKFYQIFDEFVSNAARHRQTALLLPAFTPPLDTPVGVERMNVQLVDITREGDEWKFDFKRLRTFVKHCLKDGIKLFEHCHLFSQWGAKAAPNIYDPDGNRIFGFDTDAVGDEYVHFIRAYLKAFFAFAKEEGIDNKVFFHISDEPGLHQLESYGAAYSKVADLLEGYITADAMSQPEFQEAGLVKHPIANAPSMELFKGRNENFWLYYTGSAKTISTTNRLISNTAARTRVLGLQLYHYKCPGFLHWGYNFYYDRLSAGRFNPACAPNAYKNFPGAAHLVYPVFGKDVCHVAPSIREKNMAEAVDDWRALKLLETAIGREAVEKLCEDFLGAPIDNGLVPEGDALFHLREKINQKIKELCV